MNKTVSCKAALIRMCDPLRAPQHGNARTARVCTYDGVKTRSIGHYESETSLYFCL